MNISRNNLRLHFIKCDAEGGELDIILGALELIRSDRPGWLLEVSRDNSSELFRLLQELGYRAFVYDGQKLTPTEGYRDKQFSNYFFFHPDSKIWSRAINQN